MADLKELRDARGKAIADARAILDRAEAEKRDMTADEETQYQAFVAESNKVKARIDREEQLQSAEREAVAQALKVADQKAQPEKSTIGTASPEYIAAFDRALRYGVKALNTDEIRALSSGVPTEGGYLVMPEQMVDQLLKNVDDLVFIRQKATKFTLPTAASLGVPTLDANPDDAEWTVELKTGSEDTAMKFGKRALTPHPMAKRLKLSNQLIRQVPGVQGLVNERLGYKVGITQEKAYLSGSGAQQPLGLFTASADGIPTTRDVSTGNTTTAITFDGLTEAKYSVKGQYMNRADWLFHRDALKVLAKIKDGDGQYIWRESIRSGEPDTLLGRPFSMSEYVPNTFTTGKYVGMFGDFSYYWIVDALNMQIQVLDQLYAETNQTGIILRYEGDGQPVLAEAFSRVKLG